MQAFRLLNLLLCVLILSGCGPSYNRYLIKSAQEAIAVAYDEKTFLDLNVGEDPFVSVSHLNNPQQRIDMSHSISAANQSVPQAPGVGPGGAAAAYMISTLIIKNSADHSMYKEANSQAELLINETKEETTKQRIRTLIREHIMRMDKFTFADAGAVENECCRRKFIVRPHVQLSNDLGTAEVKVDFSLIDTSNDKLIYQNSLIYVTNLLPTLYDIGYWVDDDAKLFLQSLDTAFGEIVIMLDFDLFQNSSSNNSKMVTLKYKNDTGTYYERGFLLWSTDQRLVIRDLRGNIRSFHGSLL